MKVISLLILMFSGISAFGQKVTYNHTVNSSDAEVIEIMLLFENYLASNPQEKAKNSFWNEEDQKKSIDYDFLEGEFQPSLYMGFPVHVLSINKKEDYWQIKAQFGYTKQDETPYILAIVNYIVKKESGNFKLFNALSINRLKWKNTKVRFVDFYYPDYHNFKYDTAEKLNDFIVDLCKNFGVRPRPIEYYLADKFGEIQKLKGFDYYLGMGADSMPSGKASDDKVYCGGLGEYYTHEVFHAEIDHHFPNKHTWASEGIATFIGGSRGKTLKWHIQRTNEFLSRNPEIDLCDMLSLRNLDEKTSYQYVLGGLIAKNIYEIGGWDLLKEFMSSGTEDEDYYNAIEKYLGVTKTGLNHYLRGQLKKQSL